MDISPASSADFVGDFNNIDMLPSILNGFIGAIYTNSVDHCVKPELSIANWLNKLPTGGILLIDFDVTNEKPTYSDVSIFTKASVNKFLESFLKNFPVECVSTYSSSHPNTNTDGYLRVILKKDKDKKRINLWS